MSGFRLNSCRWFAAAFTLWFALLNWVFTPAYLWRKPTPPAQTDALQPVQYVHGFVADRLNGFCPPLPPANMHVTMDRRRSRVLVSVLPVQPAWPANT